jgi:predicted metal-binding membrane protein
VNFPQGLSPHTLRKNLTFSALFAIAAIAWVFLVRSEAAMRSMTGDGPLIVLMRLMMRPADPLPYFLAAALMWVAMMIGMMTPAVVPMVMVLRGMDRAPNRERDTLLFASGYLVGWSVFGLVAALLQLWLHTRGLLEGHLLAVSVPGAGILLLAAGMYQLTPLKEACLHHCRSPVGFFLEHWSAGAWGAVGMGVRHGLYCVGCCWVLMLLMFVGGAMSVPTMAVLCGFILAERLLPAGPWVSRIPGAAMILCGAALLGGGS